MLLTEWKLEEAQRVWFEEGRVEGRVEGESKGELKGILKTARAMFADGDSLEKIARNTGLPLDTLKEELHVQ